MDSSPRYSIITITDDPKHLIDLWNSLNLSEFPPSWEWIIGANIKEAAQYLWRRTTPLFAGLSNIILLPTQNMSNQSIGSLRQFCAEKSTGNYLLFMDSKNVLLQGSLSRIANILATNFADLLIVGYPETPTDMCQSDAYKNDLHIWKRSQFFKLNGYNTVLENGLHYEAMCRAYIAKFNVEFNPVVAIKISEESLVEKDAITQRGILHRMFYALIQEKARRLELPRADLLMPGGHAQEGHIALFYDISLKNFISFDGVITEPQDIVFGIIRAVDFLNYIPQEQVFGVMEKIWNFLIPEGWLVTSTPSTNGAGAFADPRSRSYWNNQTFSFFCLAKENNWKYGFNGLFEYTRVWEALPTAWHTKNNILYVHADLKRLEKNAGKLKKSP